MYAFAAKESFKITLSEKFDKADSMILDIMEGKQLRGRVSATDVTPTKLVNMYKKKILATITPDKYLHNDITSLQEPGRTTLLRLSYPGKSNHTYSVLLVNAHNKPVYTAADITDKMTLTLRTVDIAEGSMKSFKWITTTAKELARAGIGFRIVLADTATAKSDTVWVIKGPKARITNECPVAGLTEYIKEYGSRGNITVTENKREGGMLVFTHGCRLLKGSPKVLLEKLKSEKEAHTAHAADDHGMGTLVGFRKVKKDGEIVAVFPRDIGRNGKVTIFTLSDEHGEVAPTWITRNTVPAKPIEYKELQSVLSHRYGKITYAPSSVICDLLKAGKK